MINASKGNIIKYSNSIKKFKFRRINKGYFGRIDNSPIMIIFRRINKSDYRRASFGRKGENVIEK